MAFGFKIIDPNGRVLSKSIDEKNTTLKEMKQIAGKELRRRNIPKGSHSVVFKIPKQKNIFDVGGF